MKRLPPGTARVLAALALLLGAGCAAPPEGPLVIAHRGASGLAPEHTRASFELAVALGVDYIEQDLQLTADGVLVILHDETLERTARGPAEDCTGPVRSRTLAELERCDFGAWFDERAPEAAPRFVDERILTLDALFARFGRSVRYYIETKHPEHAPGMEEALIALLAEHDLLPSRRDPWRVIVQSFSPESLKHVQALSPDLPRVQLVHGELGAPLETVFAAVAAYAVGIAPHRSQVDADFLAGARRHGLAVHAYTVNETDEMRRLLDLGVDGLFTDRPDRMIELLEER